MIPRDEIKKILIIKLRGIGDVVLSTIVLDNLRESFPNSTIDYLTDFSSKPGLEGLKQINSVIEFPRTGLLERIKLFYNIRRSNYDLIFDFFSNPATAQLTFFSGAPYRVGFPYKGRKYAYNFYGPEERSSYHSALLHIMTLKNLKLINSNSNLYYYLSDHDILFANKVFNSNNLNNIFVVGISPSGGWKSKKCDPAKFAEIGNAIQKKYNCKIIIVWGNSDKEDAESINKLIDNSVLAPSTSIREMAALISKCDILIANDSGPMHISTAVGTPVLSLHGPTNPKLQGPFGENHEYIIKSDLDCIICNLLECPKNHECFVNLNLEEVLDKVDKLIVKNMLEVNK